MADELDNLSTDELRRLVSELDSGPEEPPPIFEERSGLGGPGFMGFLNGLRDRAVVNNLLQSRPNALKQYLGSIGYDVAEDENGRLGVRQQGDTGPYGRIEPEGWFGGGSGIPGGTGELLADMLVDTPNDVLAMSGTLASSGEKVLAAPLRALGINVGMGAATGAAAENLTDAGAEYLGVPPAEETGDMGPTLRGGISGGIGGAMQTFLGGLGEGIFGGPSTNQVGQRMVKESLDIPNKELSGGAVSLGTDAAGNPIPVVAGYNGAELQMTSPAQEVLDALQNDYGFFAKVRQVAQETGEDYYRVADKLTQAELKVTGERLGGVAEKLAKDPATTQSFSQVATQMEGARDAIKQRLQVSLSSDPSVNVVSFGDQVDSAVQSQIDYMRNTATSLVKREMDTINSQIAAVEKSGTGVQIAGQDVGVGLKAAQKKLGPLEKKLSNGETLSKKEQTLYSTLKPKADALQAKVDELTNQFFQKDAMLADPPVNFALLNGTKMGLYTEAAKFFEANPQKLNAAGVALKDISGAMGEYVAEVAKAAKDPTLQPLFVQFSKQYSHYRDFSRYGAAAFGEMDKMAERAGLLSRLRPSAYMRGGASGVTPRFLAVLRSGVDNARTQFKDGIDKLANPDPGRISQIMAAATAFGQTVARTPVNTIVSSQLGRSISGPLSGSQFMNDLSQRMTLSALSDMGIISEAQAQEGLDLNQVPPEALDFAKQSIGPSLQTLQDAIKFGGEEEVGAALSQITKKFPELFPEPRTGIKGEVEVDGVIKLYDPMDRARYAAKIQNDDSIDWEEKADIVSEMNASFTARIPRGKR